MTITTRLRKSSSPSRWLMGLPPTSPRFKFVHTHPVNAGNSSAVPRRPPRQPPSPSTRSRSLELLDQQVQERKSPSVTSAIVQRPPLPRPRSRSLDGLLDEDTKSGGGEQDKTQNRGCSMTNSEEKTVLALKANQKQPDSKAIAAKNEPRPMPRTKPRMSDIIEAKSEAGDVRVSLDKDEDNKEAPTRPPKPSLRQIPASNAGGIKSVKRTNREPERRHKRG
ncbi:hypothetical protein X777_10707 [Ooceraea biroi]|uniref:Uncharacterized protein n=1 Tax=Ooceraea biroi TaxID=2015173 RepID=A0A026W646_OOCBI|nr:hypothetical protein X777_10707 [Ooceraea biroi]